MDKLIKYIGSSLVSLSSLAGCVSPDDYCPYSQTGENFSTSRLNEAIDYALSRDDPETRNFNLLLVMSQYEDNPRATLHFLAYVQNKLTYEDFELHLMLTHLFAGDKEKCYKDKICEFFEPGENRDRCFERGFEPEFYVIVPLNSPKDD